MDALLPDAQQRMYNCKLCKRKVRGRDVILVFSPISSVNGCNATFYCSTECVTQYHLKKNKATMEEALTRQDIQTIGDSSTQDLLNESSSEGAFDCSLDESFDI